MPAPRKFSDEMRERAKRMVREARAQEPGLSVNAGCKRIGRSWGSSRHAARVVSPGRCRRRRGAGVTTALTTLLSEELKRLRQQNAELRRYARHLRIRGDVRGSLSGTLATMGPAVPYAIGAEFAHPDRPAIAVLAAFGLLFCAVAALICLLAGSTWAAVALAVVAVIALVDLARVLHRKRRGEPG